MRQISIYFPVSHLGEHILDRYRYEEYIYHLLDEYASFMWNITDKG